MTHKQALWAARHDWYVETIRSGEGHGLMVKVDNIEKNFKTGEVTATYLMFTDFEKLKEWAGY
jgi:hypothetical protein